MGDDLALASRYLARSFLIAATKVSRAKRRGEERAESAAMLISAIGLPGNSALLTSQSNAFFSEPGTPRAYSGARTYAQEKQTTTANGRNLKETQPELRAVFLYSLNS